MALTPCSHCRRHVRSAEAWCPFCAGALTHSRAAVDERARALRTAGRLGRAAMAAFGAAAMSTSISACGARGGIDLGVRPPLAVDAATTPIDGGVDTGTFIAAYGTPSDAGLDLDAGDDAGASHAEYGGPPLDAGPEPDAAEVVLPAYGGPWFDEDAGTDAGCVDDPGCTSADYGGPPEP